MSVLEEFTALPSHLELESAVKQGQLYRELVRLAKQDTSYPLSYTAAEMLQKIGYNTDLTNERQVKELVDMWYGEQALWEDDSRSVVSKRLAVLHSKFISALVKYTKEMGWPEF